MMQKWVGRGEVTNELRADEVAFATVLRMFAPPDCRQATVIVDGYSFDGPGSTPDTMVVVVRGRAEAIAEEEA